ncbi:MAG: glutamate-5-semialdehyde dehydrogenase [Fibrobacter sp.]|nr:glutamate-5-semialdehyde dehydrogenase [Fibrobacter sp.]
MKLNDRIENIAIQARKTALKLQDTPVNKLNSVLLKMADLIEERSVLLKRENEQDLVSAQKKNLSSAMIDRLTLSDKTIASMINGLRKVASLNSPLGTRFDEFKRPDGLLIYKIKVPVGVVGIIYESRPNVTVDAAAICLKSGNAVILRGGSEAFHSNMALAALFSEALEFSGLYRDAVQIIPVTDREAVNMMLVQDKYIDLIIPRGGEQLIKTVVENSRIPVIKHYKGVCHVYISSHADLDKAVAIAVNAKAQRPGVCNAMETLLLDVNIERENRVKIIQKLLENGISIFGDPQTAALAPDIKEASEEDWNAEYLDLRLAVKTVNGIDEAIEHINRYGSHHTDAIVTESKDEIDRFIKQTDSSSVMINASTRFSDGGEYGMGCEIGISTDKLHARGPMGIADLTTYKWIVEGNGHIRS